MELANDDGIGSFEFDHKSVDNPQFAGNFGDHNPKTTFPSIGAPGWNTNNFLQSLDWKILLSSSRSVPKMGNTFESTHIHPSTH